MRQVRYRSEIQKLKTATRFSAGVGLIMMTVGFVARYQTGLKIFY